MNPRPWTWSAAGKHPVAVDYIRLAIGSPLIEAVCDWVTKGYDRVHRKAEPNAEQHSWRFWLRGAKKDRLICGLGRDSSDGIGRPYPFFIMGEGTLNGWEREWDRIPLSLNSTWQRMESIAAGRYADIQTFFEQLERLPAPAGGGDHQTMRSEDDPVAVEEIAISYRDALINTGRAFIDLGVFTCDNPSRSISRCLGSIKSWFKEPPPAVFLGGTPRKSYLAVIAAPLNVEDFLTLWSA